MNRLDIDFGLYDAYSISGVGFDEDMDDMDISESSESDGKMFLV